MESYIRMEEKRYIEAWERGKEKIRQTSGGVMETETRKKGDAGKFPRDDHIPVLFRLLNPTKKIGNRAGIYPARIIKFAIVEKRTFV